MYPSIPEKLQSLYEKGYKQVIFMNESNIDRRKNKRKVAVDSKVGCLKNFIKHVKFPMQKHFNSGIPIDMDQSFYVGDAAGRPDDHSDADIKFAQV
ncbi:hypothetical protein DITRI_Ditri02bG0179400 [Diplodiscus trichospermus]